MRDTTARLVLSRARAGHLLWGALFLCVRVRACVCAEAAEEKLRKVCMGCVGSGEGGEISRELTLLARLADAWPRSGTSRLLASSCLAGKTQRACASIGPPKQARLCCVLIGLSSTLFVVFHCVARAPTFFVAPLPNCVAPVPSTTPSKHFPLTTQPHSTATIVTATATATTATRHHAFYSVEKAGANANSNVLFLLG